MTTPTHNDIAIPPGDALCHTLYGVFQLCDRLTIWELEHADSGLPLTELVCNEIQRLCAIILPLEIQITKPGCVPSESLRQTLVRFQTQLSGTLDLVSFHKLVEPGGQEGYLNVLYARTYILNQDTIIGTHHLYGREECLVRLGLELWEHVAAGVQDNPTESMTAGVAVQRFQHLEPRLRDYFSRVQEQFTPRYVHDYTSLADTPYVVDPIEGTSSGSYGIVRKVYNKESGEPLAMKTFREVFHAEQMKKILTEIGILEVCNHKNIVRFVQAFRTDDEDDQPVHFVMAPWAPYTLSRFLNSPDDKRKARCPWFQQNSSESNRCIYQIMYELADAVDYLHKHDIKHKDLKPANILLYQEKSQHPTALITDVGVSKIYKPGGSTNFNDSTYEYLAPEQHEMIESTFKSDVWQLGCCFAEFLAVANKGKSGYEELQDSFLRDGANYQCSIAFEQPSFISTLGAICKRGNSAQKRAYAVVVGMLDLNPQDRPSIDAVKAALMKLPGVNTEAANC